MMSELLKDPHHVRGDLKLMETAVTRSAKHPEIPVSQSVIDSMPAVAAKMLHSEDERIRCRASELLLKFLQYNASLNPPEQKQPQTTINVGVNVDNRTESREALQFLERFREGKLLGEAE